MKAVEALEQAERALRDRAASQRLLDAERIEMMAATATIGKMRGILADPGLWRTLRRSETRVARQLLALLGDGGTR